MGLRRINVAPGGPAECVGRPAPAPVPALLALQHLCGNRAVARLLAPAAQATVQRYVPVNQAGVMAPEIARNRAVGGEAGFTMRANRGWIQIGTPAAPQPKHIEASVHPTHGLPGSGAHTEELLVAWAQTQGANLALAPTDPSAASRVLSMYSERQPCTTADADADRQLRPPGSCHTYLTNTLHAAVPVRYSVDGPAPLDNMLRDERAKFVRQQQIARVNAALRARRTAVGWHPDLGNLVNTAIGNIRGVPHPHSNTQFDTFKAAAIAAANTAIAAIQAWNPPPAPAPAPARPPSPPGPPGPGPSGKRSLPADPGTGKRPRVSTT